MPKAAQLDMGLLGQSDFNIMGRKRTNRQKIRGTYHRHYSVDRKQLEMVCKSCYTDGKFMKLFKAGQNYIFISLSKKGRQKFEKEPETIVSLINEATYTFINDHLITDGTFTDDREELKRLLEVKYEEDGMFAIYL